MEEYNAKIQEQNKVYFNKYNLEVIQHVELNNHPKIKERIEQYGDNFVIH